MEYIKLCDICDFQGGSQPPKDEWSFEPRDGYIRMLQIRDFTQGERVTPEYIKITKTTKVCKADDILIARYGASLGKILTGLSGAYNVAIMRTIPNTKLLEKKYLYYYLKSSTFQTFLLNIGNRAAQAGFNKKDLEELRIPNISREAQCEIVSILERVETIISTRQQQLKKLDDLVKARFVELFGDPLKNDKGFPTVMGEVLFKLSNGKALPNNKRFTVGVPAYGGNGVSWCTDEILCDYDTIIIGRVGFQSGNVHLAKAPLWVTDNAMYISGINNKECDIRFLCSLMEHLDFKRYQDAGDLKKITQKPFMQMHYLLPPISLQKQYIAFVEQTDKSKSAVQKALDEAQLLFNSVVQEYFG